MKIELLKNSEKDCRVLFFFEDENIIIDNSEIQVDDFAFDGKLSSTYLLSANGKKNLLVGLGKKDGLSLNSFKNSVMTAGKFFEGKKIEEIDIVLKDIDSISKTEILTGIVDAIIIGLYRFDIHLSKKEYSRISKVNIIGNDFDENDFAEVELAKQIAFAVNNARDLIMRNADDINPETLKNEIEAWASTQKNVSCKILNRQELIDEGMGLISAVGQCGNIGPYAIFMEYKNGGNKPTSALVGKGLTFDTGGLNLKPTGHIEDMRMDMGGAATMFSTFKALVENNEEVNVVCALGIAENLIGKNAYKPGDILKSKLGKTVEVGNTDAEGRLVLADILTFVQDNYKVDYIYDAATLTGAVTIALGLYYTAILGNNQDFINDVIEIGKETHEQIWQLPIDEDFSKMMKGSISDLTNSSGQRNGGTITAACFLQEFIKKDVKWAHFDIAGTAWVTTGNWNLYDKKYATGVMVKTFYNAIKKIK